MIFHKIYDSTGVETSLKSRFHNRMKLLNKILGDTMLIPVLHVRSAPWAIIKLFYWYFSSLEFNLIQRHLQAMPILRGGSFLR